MKQLDSLFSFVNTATFTSLEETILDLFTSLPKLPKGFTDFLVKIAPFLAIIFGILSIISAISVLTAGNTYREFFEVAGITNPYLLYIGAFKSFITGLFLITAFTHLQSRELFGWRLLFWSTAVSVILSLVAMDVIGALVSAAVSWYILAQMRPSYS